MTLLEDLQQESTDILLSTSLIIEAATHMKSVSIIVESADSVLGSLSAKLRAGKEMSEDEREEFAILYTSLSLLADANIRAGFNIDLTQADGQAKFSTILNDTGTNPAITREVAKIATETGRAKLEQTRNDLRNFSTMKELDKQLYLNRVNKLRIAFERAKNQLAQHDLPSVMARKILSA